MSRYYCSIFLTALLCKFGQFAVNILSCWLTSGECFGNVLFQLACFIRVKGRHVVRWETIHRPTFFVFPFYRVVPQKT